METPGLRQKRWNEAKSKLSFLSPLVADRKEANGSLWIQVPRMIKSNHLNACLGGFLPTWLLKPKVSC